MDNGLTKDNLPEREGVYLISFLGETTELDIYEHPQLGLCCWGPDLGYDGTHIQRDEIGIILGVDFKERIGELK